MRVLVFGATGGTGRALVEQALQQGHVVTAFVRRPEKLKISHANLTVLKGNVLNSESVESAVQGQDAVLSALGVRPRVATVVVLIILCQLVARELALSGTLNWFVRALVPILLLLLFSKRNTALSDGTKNIVSAMEKNGVKRFVCESSLGVGDSKGRLGFLYSFILVPLFLRGLFADKEVQETTIRISTLDWIIVRPVALTNAPRKGAWKAGREVGHRFLTATIPRADVAAFMLEQLADNTYLRMTPGLQSSTTVV